MPTTLNTVPPRRFRAGGTNIRWIIALVIAAVGVIGYFMKPKVTNPETGETYRVALTVDQEKALGLEAAKEMIPKLGGALVVFHQSQRVHSDLSPRSSLPNR